VPQDLLQFTYTPALDLSPDGGMTGPARMYVVENAVRRALPYQQIGGTRAFVLTPLEELAVGTHIEFEADAASCPSSQSIATRFVVTEPRTAPTSLGALSVAIERDVLTVAVSSGSCTDPIDAAYADLTVELSGDALPFVDVLRYELRVDGRPQPSFVGSAEEKDALLARGQDRVYVVCNKPHERSRPYHPLSAGKHRVQMVGVLPNGSRAYSDEVEIELQCTTDPVPDAWSGVEVERHDAGSIVDGGPQAPAADAAIAESADEPESNGGCTLAHQHGFGSNTGTLAALALFLMRRRRACRVKA
jgi:hypothetical protein